MKITIYLLIVSMVLLGCGAHHNDSAYSNQNLVDAASVEPQTDNEKTVIEKIPTAQMGKPVKIGSIHFVVTNSYFAASGKECKTIEITDPKNASPISRTVCNYDGTWGYSPDVLPTVSNQ